MGNQKNVWRAIVFLVLIIGLLYYGLSINHQKLQPKIYNVPFEFWFGILVTAVLVVITYISKSIFPSKDE